MTPGTPLMEIKGVGPAVAGKYVVLGVKTVGDLINYFPRRYDDFSAIAPINRLKPGQVTIKAEIKQATGRYVRRGMHITEAVASDKTGSVRLVWFNQPYRAAALKAGKQYFISGNFELSRQRLQIMNPSAELVSDFPISSARIISIYKQTKGLNSRQIRTSVKELLPMIGQLAETLPGWLIKQHKLVGRADAVRAIHFPETSKQLAEAKHRLGFEEVFHLTLASLLNKQEIAGHQALPVPFDERLAQKFVGELPFKLTNAQRKTVWQIYLDLQKSQPMNRLVEGDVGSGKTVVAAMAALMVLQSKKQVVLMAPTELLARQHAENITKLLEPMGYSNQVALLVGSLKPAAKKRAQSAIQSGKARFIVGTHALIQDKVDFSGLEMVIVDEQHRFGVKQRQKLQSKAGHAVHALHLTATPIPRSLALTLYGDLDLSVLDEKPPGRKPVTTKIISPNSRKQLYDEVDKKIENGQQMFVVCPLITDTEENGSSSAEKMFVSLQKGQFKHRRVGLLHGKMKAEDKQAVMEQFVAGELDILVATTVIEVGVDVPNASQMIIEGADTFGLSQLHQLRGRIGRGLADSSCYLVMSDSSAPSRRLRAMEYINDGFKLAEIDLEMRGPGAIYGQAQHGVLDLRVANLSDTKLIAAARSSAQEFIDKGENLLKYKELANTVSRLQAVTNLN